MKNRSKMKMSKSKKMFSRTGAKTHKFNLQTPRLQMRGGIRM
jgi:hypothetical protein